MTVRDAVGEPKIHTMVASQWHELEMADLLKPFSTASDILQLDFSI
jgi:hypothetical protein